MMMLILQVDRRSLSEVLSAPKLLTGNHQYSRRTATRVNAGKGVGRAKGHSDKDMRAYMQKRAAAREVFRRLGNRLANHRASLSSELGSLWDFIRIDKDRRRSAPAGTGTYEPIHSDAKSPVRLARDLLQVVQETVLKKFDEVPKRCPLVKEESDLTSSDDEEGDKRIANLIDFFFTIVKSQKDERKGSGGSCFKSDSSPTENKLETYVPTKVNTELEQKMETLIEFLASSGCMDKEDTANKEDKKITLMEFLFGPEEGQWIDKPIIEIRTEPDYKGISLSESNINVKGLSYIDETPEEEGNETLVEMLIKYMENYSSKDKTFQNKSISITPSLSEKSKSDVTISKLETFSDMNKTKSDSTLTQTQDTVIDRGDDRSDRSCSRRISETVIDLSHVKGDLEDIFDEALNKVYHICNIVIEDDTMTDQEDMENFTAYTKPPILQYIQYLPYSVELSDIMEEDEPSSRGLDRKMSGDERLAHAKQCAEDLISYIETKIDEHFYDDASSEDSREFDISSSLKRNSISLIDLRNIPDLPPSMIIKPKVVKIDRSTSTTEISESISDLSKRIDSACMTEDTTLSSSTERSERALDKIESLHRFFSKSRLEIIDETFEGHAEKIKSPKKCYDTEFSDTRNDEKAGQASLDDVEDLQDDNDSDRNGNDTQMTETIVIQDDENDVSDKCC
ncbi:unnamed protein product [Diatraea saccharalis]|uniref:Uncharacterized protein n=1 Tax=Diatraea saccharalis TaxID=40085 RepID=A0A9N9R5L6_9NEOP|nr:unnamed protein product [Diatraea saccharalis]